MVNTRGRSTRTRTASSTLPYRENMVVGKITHQLSPNNYLSVRYGFNNNSQPYGASPQTPPENWGDSKNKFHSANANLNSVLGNGKLNEFMFQYSYFKNDDRARTRTCPPRPIPNGVTVGQCVNTPQTTEQHKYQFRDDFTWQHGPARVQGGGELHQRARPSTSRSPPASRRSSRTWPTAAPRRSRTSPSTAPSAARRAQPAPRSRTSSTRSTSRTRWRVTDKLTLDLGRPLRLRDRLRLRPGREHHLPGAAGGRPRGVFSSARCPARAPASRTSARSRRRTRTTSRRAPASPTTSRVTASLVLRGGVGRYYDFAYTNANILFAVIGAQSSFGQIYSEHQHHGHPQPRRHASTRSGQPLPPNQLTNLTAPHPSHVASPRIKQPYTDQANLGFSKALGNGFAIEVDGVYARRPGPRHASRASTAASTAARRRFAGDPGPERRRRANFRDRHLGGRQPLQGHHLALKKHWDGKLQFLASYTLSDTTSYGQPARHRRVRRIRRRSTRSTLRRPRRTRRAPTTATA